MKSTKKILALLLAMVMLVTVFAACGGDDSSSASSEASSAETSGTSETSEASTSETAEEEEPEDDGTIYPVRIVQPGTTSTDNDAGLAAVNEKLKEDGVNVEVSMIKIPWDSYDQRLNLMLSTGEAFEMLHVMQDVKNLSAIVGMDALLPVDDYLDDYPELVEKFSDLEWDGALVNGVHYAIPCYWQSFDQTMSYMTVRTDVMKAVGYDEFPSDSVEDVIDLMKKSQDYILEETGIKAYHWMHQVQDTAHWLHRTYDTYPFYVENSLGIVKINQDGTVDSFYESEEFKNDANTYYEMYQAGLINPDVLSLDSQVKYDDAGLGAWLPSQTFDTTLETTIANNTDIEGATAAFVKMNPEKPEMIYTYCQNLNGISATAENPTAVLDFLDWLYADQANHDLFHYGIEGTHYTPVGDNRMEQVKGDDGNPLYQQETWMTGYLPYMRYTTDTPDSYIEYKTWRADNYVVSPAAGFLFDSTPVSSQLTNLQTEIIASIYPIKFGMVSYEDNIDQAIANLKAAGLDEYLAEYRSQFEAYLKDNPQALEGASGSTGDSSEAASEATSEVSEATSEVSSEAAE